jgi:UDP-N-acetylmuramoyl-L-alanyl-D-glutamate--2,6-diaminopimelate ligase
MKLSALIARPPGPDDPDITGLTADSRATKPGFVFFAVPGSKACGLDFARDALAQGAVAVIGESAAPLDLAGRYVQVPDVRRALALAAARMFPRQPETLVAVTGTSGKTSVADFTRQIFRACGRKSASLGTIGVVTGTKSSYGALTTPDPVSLHQTLDGLAGDGITHLAMEASSHGLAQKRLDGVRLSAAAFTNLGRDHLDYHATVEAYLAAKLRLFETLLPHGRPAVVNADGPYADAVIKAVRERGLPLLTVGQNGEWLTLLSAVQSGFNQELELRFAGREFTLTLPLAGHFQIENALVAAGLALAVGEDADRVFQALENLVGVKGRLERVATFREALIVIDYAHKPEALEQVLSSLRPYATGRLVCVFGCGGDRDRGKRPIMGAVATRGADHVIVTDDNPRSEDPAAIRAAILAKAPGAVEIGDRGEAIRRAVAGLNPGDVLVIAGKGHETGQIVGDTVLPFSDHDAVFHAIAEIAP